jgi:hypothetical protein
VIIENSLRGRQAAGERLSRDIALNVRTESASRVPPAGWFDARTDHCAYLPPISFRNDAETTALNLSAKPYPNQLLESQHLPALPS